MALAFGFQRCCRCALGVLSAGLFFEFALRPFVEDSYRPGPPSVHTFRNYYEGLAVAHFEPDGLGRLGNRLTGNPPVAGAPEGLIIGDSHVVAYSVRDQDTMGSVVERLSRASGRALNVRQYGWPGANAPTFLAGADKLRESRNPAWVAVVLNSYNIGVNALASSSEWRVEVAPDYSLRLIQTAMPRRSPAREAAVQWSGRSTLALALWRRLGLIWSRRSPGRVVADASLEEQAARVPRAIVIALKRAYGAHLLIVYAPPDSNDAVEPIETGLRGICAEQDVAFVSATAALARDRTENARFSRGFPNTAPGVGHFNAVGHRIIGEEIWRYLDSHSAPPMSH